MGDLGTLDGLGGLGEVKDGEEECEDESEDVAKHVVEADPRWVSMRAKENEMECAYATWPPNPQ